MTYYVNKATGESALSPPLVAEIGTGAGTGAGAGAGAGADAPRWLERVSRTTGLTYFVNLETGLASSERPGLAADN